MEVAFGQEAYGTHFDGFMRHYLTFKTGDIPNVRAVYEAFKGHARSPTSQYIRADRLQNAHNVPLVLHRIVVMNVGS